MKMSKIIIGNQKMYMDKEDVLSFVSDMKSYDKGSVPVILCPTFVYLDYYKDVCKVGAQNVALNDNGSYTGEVSASQLSSLGINYCIVGHSERRNFQKETDEEINIKIKKLLERNIVPILCVGEKKEERDNNLTEIIIKKELEQDLKDITRDNIDKIIIAYEPIWAIGTGLTPTNSEIDETITFIKNYLKTIYRDVNVTLLYGGSVSEKNVDELNSINSVDGYLIGGASTKFASLSYIIDSQK